jgi:hypothetical protein
MEKEQGFVHSALCIVSDNSCTIEWMVGGVSCRLCNWKEKIKIVYQWEGGMCLCSTSNFQLYSPISNTLHAHQVTFGSCHILQLHYRMDGGWGMVQAV